MSLNHVTTMPDLQHKDDQLMIFKTADHAIIANAIAPQTSEIGPQATAAFARIS